MDAASWGFIGTLFGALVGAFASIATTFFNNRHAAKLHSRSSELARDEQRRIFQRQTLLEIQDTLPSLYGATLAVYKEWRAYFDERGRWDVELSDETDKAFRKATGSFGKLAERVADDALRDELKKVLKLTRKIKDLKKVEDALHILEGMSVGGENAVEHIGAALRAQY